MNKSAGKQLNNRFNKLLSKENLKVGNRGSPDASKSYHAPAATDTYNPKV